MTEATRKSTRARTSRKGNAAPEVSAHPEITLGDVVDATLDPNKGFAMATGEFVLQNEAHGFIEVHPENIGPNGEAIIRATAAGIAYVQAERTSANTSDKVVDNGNGKHVESVSTVEQEQSQPQQQQTQPAVTQIKESKKMSFAIETVDIPAVKRGRGAASQYPFDALEVGQSFFVPDAGEKKAAKSIASSVSAANVRYSEVVEGQTRTNRKGNVVPVTKQVREFSTRSVEKDPVHGVAGVRVVRTK